MSKYVATALTYDNEVVSNETMDNLIGEIYSTEFYGRIVPIEFFKHKDKEGATHLMARWKSKQHLKDDKHYVDVELSCEADEVTGEVVRIVGVPAIKISPSHANSSAIKAMRWETFIKNS